MKITMKALSVQLPWAWWIMRCGKGVENRTWKTKYRGRILIHASRRWDNNAPRQNWLINNQNLTDEEIENQIDLCRKFDGLILGSVELYDCVQNSEDKWAQPGMWHWLLRDPDIWDIPILHRGSLGLWTFSGEVG
jgi:hypothetical protein